MGKSVDKKTLVKMAKALNKLDLTEEEIDVESKPAELAEDFISAIEEIDDAGEIDEVSEKIIKFYEGLLDDVDGDDPEKDDDDDDDDKKKAKKGKKEKKAKKGKKEKKAKKGKAAKKDEPDEDEPDEDEPDEDEPEVIDLDAVSEEIEEMDFDELETWCEENHPDFDFDYDEDDDDPEDDIVPAIMKYLKKLAKAAGKAKKGKKEKKAKKGKKDKKAKKGKKEKKAKGEKLPKGIRTGTLPAALYSAIGEDGATWAELAKVCGKEKDKEWEKCMGMAMRTVSRKVSKAVPVNVLFTGDDDAAKFTLASEEDDD